MPPIKFHNPYHFVPVMKGAGELRKDISFTEMEQSPFVRHDTYAAEGFSGKIVCRLVTKTPLLNGGEQTKGDYNHRRKVRTFRDDTDLAASSLRGMIGSLIEAASNSALRVMNDNPGYSFRKPAASQALSAIGMVIVQSNGAHKLIPFCLPTIKRNIKDDQTYWRLEDRWHPVFTRADVKVYLGDWDSIRKTLPNEKWFHTYVHGTDPIQSRVYGMRLDRRPLNNGRISHDDWLHVKVADEGKYEDYLLAQDAPDDELLPRPWNEIPADEQDQYVPGLIRVLGCQGRSDIPKTKEHELFLPLPPGLDWDEQGFVKFVKPKLLDIPDSVRRRFEELADERTGEDGKSPFPYEPLHTRPGRNGNKNFKLRLKTGDLVYFDVTRDSKNVRELSFSSIWRGRAEEVDKKTDLPIRDGSTKNFFLALGDPEVLPMSPERKKVTIAEQMLGFVEIMPEEAKPDRQAHGLASRVKFSDALLAPGQERSSIWYKNGEKIPLRVLDSPKPPSPTFYFEAGGQAIPKVSLSLEAHRPQGRKQYLHAQQGEKANQEPFRSMVTTAQAQDQGLNKPDRTPGGWTQFTEAKLLNLGVTYYFDVRFDNLTRRELALLVYALEPAEGDAYWHKLGLGKPIGLGSVKIDIAGVYLVERAERYSAAGFAAPRYAKGWVMPGVALPEEDRFEMERAATFVSGLEFSPATLREETRKDMNLDIRKAIELMGNPSEVKHPVHVPSFKKPYNEQKTYEWFTENEKPKRRRQQLLPLREGSPGLPVLNGWEEE